MQVEQISEHQGSSDGLYVTEPELYRRMGLPPDKGRLAVAYLEKTGFPRRQEIFGNRRYWPAVRAYLDRMNGVRVGDRVEEERHGRRLRTAEN